MLMLFMADLTGGTTATGKQPAWPTDRQAEVLYPGELSCDYLQRIDVQTEESTDSIYGALGALNVEVDASICFRPEVFQ